MQNLEALAKKNGEDIGVLRFGLFCDVRDCHDLNCSMRKTKEKNEKEFYQKRQFSKKNEIANRNSKERDEKETEISKRKQEFRRPIF